MSSKLIKVINYKYVSRTIKKPFEIQHIWADKYERYQDQFSTPEEFAEYRNRLGGLVLLPRGFNLFAVLLSVNEVIASHK